MLIISRCVGDSLTINGDIKVVVLEVRGKQVRLGIDAPRDILILRDELTPFTELADKAS